MPDEAKTEELSDLIEWLGEMVRQVDSSLLDEWEQLQNPARVAVDDRAARGHPQRRAFRVQVRNAMFRRVELAALRRCEALASSTPRWTGPTRWRPTSTSTTRSATGPAAARTQA